MEGIVVARRHHFAQAARILPALLAWLLACAAAGPAAAAIRAGQPLAAALEELRAQGLKIVYSSALVAPQLRVIEPPRGATPLAQAQELLAPHGLELRALRGGLYAIERARGARRARIGGRVIDSGDKRPIRSARIELLDPGTVAWSQRDGSFALAAPGTAGARTLRISAEGYATTSLALAQAAPAGASLVVELDRTAAALDEVTVLASRYVYEQTSAGQVFTLDRDDIRAQPSVGEDALQSVARLPGFAFSGLSARPNIRGGEEGEALILLDGMPIRQAFHMPSYTAVFSVLDEDLIERIDVFTGALPARHGNRLSAVLELESRRAGEQPRRALGASVFNVRGRTAGRSERTGTDWLAAGRVGVLRPLLDEFAPEVGRPSYADAFARGSWETPSGTRVRAQLLWADDELTYFDPETGEHAELESRNHYGWLGARHTLRENLAIELLAGTSLIESLRSGELAGGLTATGELADRRRSTLWDVRARLHWEPTPSHALEAGFAGVWGNARYDYASSVEFEAPAQQLFALPETIARAAAIDIGRTSLALFAADRWQVAERLFLELGARLDRERGGRLEQHTSFSPRLSARFDLGRQTRLRASWGEIFQQDEVHELQVGDGIEHFQPAQRVAHLVLGLEHRLPAGVALRAELFRKRLANPRARFENLFDPLRFLPELSADRVRVAPQSAELEGAELTAQWEREAWNLWSTYTWSRYADRVDGREVLRSWDQKHTATLALAWRRAPWTASALATVRSGRPTTPVESLALEAPRLGPRNGARLGSYASVDLRIERQFPLAHGRVRVFAQVTNLLDRANRCCSELDLPDEESSDPGLLELEPQYAYPLLPALGVSWEF